jgi:hypothetical protein
MAVVQMLATIAYSILAAATAYLFSLLLGDMVQDIRHTYSCRLGVDKRNKQILPDNYHTPRNY